MQKKKILLVEDEDSIREILKLNLETENYDITDLENGFKILENDSTYTSNYHLIILDIMLPKTDGITLCEYIRKKNSLKKN